MMTVIMPLTLRDAVARERSFLDRSGIVCRYAGTNEETLSLHREHNATLIIALLDSPGMNGEDLCSAIRDSRELAAVSIILIGSGNETDSERCLRCSANSFVRDRSDMIGLLQEAHQLLHVAPRTAHRVPVSVRVLGSKGQQSLVGESINISASGMLLRSDRFLHEGDTVRCTFTLPGATAVSANAEVVRAVDDPGGATATYGIRFIDIETKVMSALDLFLGGHATAF